MLSASWPPVAVLSLQEPVPFSFRAVSSLRPPAKVWKSLRASTVKGPGSLKELVSQAWLVRGAHPVDLVPHHPAAAGCTDTSPALATDPKLGLVSHPRGDDEDHRSHSHQGRQPAAAAEGLPHRPGTRARGAGVGRGQTDPGCVLESPDLSSSSRAQGRPGLPWAEEERGWLGLLSLPGLV